MVNYFVKHMCKLGGGLFIKKSELFDSYIKWCAKNNIPPVTKKMMGIYLIDCYVLARNSTTADGKSRAWYGIDLIDSQPKDYKVYP